MELNPHKQYPNLTNTLAELAEKLRPQVRGEPFQEDQWLEFINQHLQDFSDTTFCEKDLQENEKRMHDATFSQTDNLITITLLTQDDKVAYDEQKIDSPVLKGLWWGPVTNIEKTIIGEGDNQVVQLCFNTEYHWPTLIKGGEPDCISAFYISLVAFKLQKIDFFRQYLFYSAQHKCSTAIRAYALILLDNERFPQAAFWNIQAILVSGDHLCAHVLAKQLLHGTGVDQDVLLAEFLLCKLVGYSFSDAFLTLGDLYTCGDPDSGIEADDEKAKFLIFMAAYHFQDERAMKYIQDHHWIQDTPNIEENPDYIENLGENPQDTQENGENPEDKSSLLDWAIAGSVVASVGAVGLYALKRFLKK